MHYSIEKERSKIHASSEERLNFEPQDWRKDFKKDLSIAIKELVPDGDVFKAKLITEVREFFDVENILFYNLGTANFKNWIPKGYGFLLIEKRICIIRNMSMSMVLLSLFFRKLMKILLQNGVVS